jgi:hypothetical protein
MKTTYYNHVITAVMSTHVLEICFVPIQQKQELWSWLFWHVT